MRYQLELDIDAPRDRVVALFLDPESLQKWQPDLLSIEMLDGPAPREVGAKMKQVNRMGSREYEILETITEYDPPERFAATYESDDVWNLVENQLFDEGEKTHWILTSDFRSTALMMRMMALLMPWMFKNQTKTFMRRFKEFVEQSGN